MVIGAWVAQFAVAEEGCYCDNFWAKPVCGDDGVTYDGDCQAECAGVEVASDGPCPVVELPLRLKLVQQCTNIASVTAFPEENGHVFAAPFKNDDIDPFRVEEVQYSLINAAGIPGCSGTTPHRLDVWVQSSTFPDATPALVYSAVQTPAGGASGNSFYLVDVPDFEVKSGEVVFVGLQMVNTPAAGKLCAASCNDAPPPPGTSYWSNSAVTPYPWADLGSFGLNNVPMFEVHGYRLVGGHYGGGSER